LPETRGTNAAEKLEPLPGKCGAGKSTKTGASDFGVHEKKREKVATAKNSQ